MTSDGMLMHQTERPRSAPKVQHRGRKERVPAGTLPDPSFLFLAFICTLVVSMFASRT